MTFIPINFSSEALREPDLNAEVENCSALRIVAGGRGGA